MATLYHQVWIEARLVDVYRAISTEDGIARWWDRPRTIATALGDVLEFNPGPEHGVLKATVLQMVPDKRVEWEFVSTHPTSSPASAWTSTRALFEIRERDNMVILDFRHSGWDADSEYLGFCNYQWGVALQRLHHTLEDATSAV